MIGRWPGRWSVTAVGLGCLALCFLGSPLLDGRGDPDLWWHLLYFERMLADRAIPAVDWLSWSREGAPYLVTQWLGQALVGGFHALAGPAGLSALTWAVALSVILLAWGASLPGCDPSHRPLALALSAAVLAPMWDLYARPQILGFLAMAAVVMLVSRAMHRGRWTPAGAVMLAVTMALWVNAHGSYVVGLAYIGLAAASIVAQDWLFSRTRPHVSWLVAPVAAALATLLNPYGVGAWRYVLEIGSLQSTRLGVIAEWVPTSMGSALGSAFLMAMLATGAAMMQARPRVSQVVLYLGMSIFGLIASRHAYFSLIALVPLLANALRQGPVAALLNPILGRRVPVLVAGVALAASLALGTWLNERREMGLAAWTQRIFPTAALDFMRAHKVRGRVLNEITAGGWLAYHWRGVPVAIDGRLDLYGDQWFFTWLFARNGGPGWRDFVDSTQATVFVLQTTCALAQLLAKDPEFAVVYSDRAYSVILRKAPQHEALIATKARALEPVAIFGPKGEVALPPMGF
jgi:hypothetical protein